MSLSELIISAPETQEFKIYIPTDDNYSQLLVSRINQLIGGCTKYEGEGMWISDDNKLYDEKVVIIEAYYSTGSVNETELLRSILRWGEQTSQELVAMVINSRFVTITLDGLRSLVSGGN